VIEAQHILAKAPNKTANISWVFLETTNGKAAITEYDKAATIKYIIL
jgi:hypothetical protein